MGGGILNIISSGSQNVILNGNPNKTFWKSSYSKYTNFGKQNFRVDYDGSKTLRLSEESTFTFTIPRYADLLMDCYLSIKMPNIWSPIYPPQEIIDENNNVIYSNWIPYEFEWIENLGSQMIKTISISCGNQKLQEFSGQYLLSAVQRDFTTTKKQLFDEMTGNVPEMNDPKSHASRNNAYPNAYYTENPAGAEPSIREKILYIPLNAWFNLKSQMAFPLISTQYTQLTITITMRPIYELFRIRNVTDYTNGYPFVAPNNNQSYMQFHRFLQTPPDLALDTTSYIDKRSLWNTDIHLNCTYAFLSDDERQIFAEKEQKYLIKQIHEHNFYNITGTNKVHLDSLGLVSNWMFYLQRNDVNLRNEWSNYTNWLYTNPHRMGFMGNGLSPAPIDGNYTIPSTNITIGAGINSDDSKTQLMITDDYNIRNEKEILLTMGILLDGQYRENILPSGLYNYIEKYVRTEGFAPPGLYCYNFGLNTSAFNLQPSGAINMTAFNSVELEFVAIVPPVNPMAQTLTICNPETNEIIGINKPTWQIFDYNFNLTVFEERYNIINIVSGEAGLMYAT